jgi:TolA-binding protein
LKERDVGDCVSLFRTPLILLYFIVACTSQPQSLHNEAEKQFRAGNYQTSRSLYIQIAENFPKSRQAPDAYYWAGMISYLYLKEPKRAIDYFQKVISDYPASEAVIPTRGYLAEIYDKEFHEPRLAIGEYQKMIEETPEHLNEDEYLYRIGEVYFNQGDLDQSKIEWEELIKKYPSGKWTDRAAFQVAMTSMIRQNFEEGLRQMNEFIKTYGKSSFLTEARFERAVCLEETGRKGEAIQAYQELLSSYPNRPVIEGRLKRLSEKQEVPPS